MTDSPPGPGGPGARPRGPLPDSEAAEAEVRPSLGPSLVPPPPRGVVAANPFTQSSQRCQRGARDFFEGTASVSSAFLNGPGGGVPAFRLEKGCWLEKGGWLIPPGP